VWWIVGVVAVVVVVSTYLTWTASRVDRLHARAAAAHSALDAHLVRRAAAATELSEALGHQQLRLLARAALDAPAEDRELAENDLTRALRALPGALPAAPGTVNGVANGPVRAAVVVTSRRVALTRQVHNDLVRDALAVRRRRLVRLLRMSRKHPEPRYFDVDDPILDDAMVG
jgi:hypothetical protein